MVTRKLRLLYALGPGDVVSSFQHWLAGADLLSETSRTFSGQFFDLCRSAGYHGHAISYYGQANKSSDGLLTAENRPKLFHGTGLGYHLCQALYALSILWTAIRWRADVVIADSGTTNWIFLAPLRLAGIRIVGVLHNVPWPHGFRPKGLLKRVVLASEGWFWRRIATAAICVSPECARQVRELAGKDLTALQIRAQFHRHDFALVASPPPIADVPFRVAFAGRIETYKGVFDLVEICEFLERTRPGKVRFDICGTGSVLPQLIEVVEARGLKHAMNIRGKLKRTELLNVYGSSHVVIAPTRSDFCEGLTMVVVEGVLCGRPVITSKLTNTFDVLNGALILATPNDPRSYADAILHLLDHPEDFEKLRAGCGPLQDQFYDPATNLTQALGKAVGGHVRK